MSYLREKDYFSAIQQVQYNQLSLNDAVLRATLESIAIGDITSRLTQRYDIAGEFTETTLFSMATTYKAGNRFYLDASTYVATAAYAIGDLTLQAGKVYHCKNTIALPGEVFNSAHWDLLGNQYDLFCVTLPQPMFNNRTVYQILNGVAPQVFWKDKVYTAKLNTPVCSHSTYLQFGDSSNVPTQNVFPDDVVSGFQYWGTGIAYSVTSGTLPTNTSYFTKGDNRDPKMVQVMIDLVIYYSCRTLAPANIPQNRIDAHDIAMLWLKDVGKGVVTAALPQIQPEQGNRIRYGGRIKNQNSY